MIKNINCICQFNPDGSIIPIKFKVEDEHHQLQTFSIKRYRPLSIHRKTEKGYHSLARHTPYILDFECIVEVFGVEKRILLKYFMEEHRWKVIY